MAQPPSYDATKPSDEPPAYQPPTTFLIGAHKLNGSLVQIKDLKLHLALLHAFAELRTQVENQTGDAASYFPQEAQRLSPERRWTWFVHLAVERFERWTRHLPRTPPKGADSLWDEMNAPPLDVWLVWHAYLLNPRCYAEDTQRVPDLACLGDLHARSAGIFFSALEQLGDPAALTTGASPERRETWQRHTGLPFDPIECTSVLTSQNVECPKCGRVSEAPYITAEGTGFAQQQFSIVCKQDGFTINREGLAVARFSKDLASDHLPAEKLGDPSRFLANSLRTPTKDLDYRRAKLIKDVFLSAMPVIHERVKKATGADPGLSYAIVRELGWQWSRLQGTTVYKIRTRLMSRVLMAYNDQRPFSVELVGAVLRQGSFVTKMSHLGWTAPGCFDTLEDERALHHASARYHAFLDLMASSPDAFFVPTLDIDLAWHTHQLFAAKYNSDCLRLIGRFVDHDDKVEEVHLADAFDVTCRAWNARFGVQYMHCGCPLPGATVGQRLSRLIQRATHHAHSGSALRSSEAAATHPSDHNGIYVPGATTDAALAEHTAKLAKRRERDLKLVQKGKMAREDYDRGGMHGAAFLYPVPIWYAAAGCAVGAGGVGTWGYAGCSVGGGAACTGGGFSCGGGAGACGGGAGGGGCGGGGGGGGGCGGGGGGGGGCGGGGGGGGS